MGARARGCACALRPALEMAFGPRLARTSIRTGSFALRLVENTRAEPAHPRNGQAHNRDPQDRPITDDIIFPRGAIRPSDKPGGLNANFMGAYAPRYLRDSARLSAV